MASTAKSPSPAGVTGSVIMQILVYLLLPGFWPYEIFTFIMLVSIGFLLTSATTMAMDEGRAMIGTASAVFGASGFLTGGVVSPLVGLGNIMSTTLLLLAICAVGTATFAFTAFRRNPTAQAA